MDTHEYKTLTKCSSRLASCIQQSPNDIVVQLRPSGILAPEDVSYFDNPHHNNDQKAQKIVEVVLNQVKINSQVFSAFVLALEAAGSWTKTVVSELKDMYRVPSFLESPCPEHRDNSTQETLTADSLLVRSLYQVVEAEPTLGDIESSRTDRELRRETHHMRIRFAGLVVKVIASIELAKVTVKSLVTYFRQIKCVSATVVIVSGQGSCSLFPPQVIREFETGDIDNMFRILKDYFSWFNFELIEAIIKVFCYKDVALKRELSDYKDHMKQYCKNRLFEFSDGFGEHRDHVKSYIFIIDKEWETMRFSELETIKTIICGVLGLKGDALFLRTVHVANVGIHDRSKFLPLSKCCSLVHYF